VRGGENTAFTVAGGARASVGRLFLFRWKGFASRRRKWKAPTIYSSDPTLWFLLKRRERCDSFIRGQKGQGRWKLRYRRGANSRSILSVEREGILGMLKKKRRRPDRKDVNSRTRPLREKETRRLQHGKRERSFFSTNVHPERKKRAGCDRRKERGENNIRVPPPVPITPLKNICGDTSTGEGKKKKEHPFHVTGRPSHSQLNAAATTGRRRRKKDPLFLS